MRTRKLTLLASLLLVFVSSTFLFVHRGKTKEPITFRGWAQFDLPTLDPQIASDSTSVGAIENLFVQLTNYDLETAAIVPEAATEWQVSDAGLRYTFKIRTDIPWVKHDPDSGETTQEVDEQGHPRFVTAHDFVYGIKRACDPNTGSYYSSVVAPQIKGCADVLFAQEPEQIPQELWDAIGVSAPDAETLVVELEFPASYFLSMTPMWTLAATPQWAIEAHGQEWIEAGNIVTNGRYALYEWKHDVSRAFVRNPLIPADMQGDGNIERFEISVVSDKSVGYALWLDGKVDQSSIPEAELQTHLEQFPDQTDLTPDLVVSYISFRMTKPPFDDVRVRRAFSAAFDREAFVSEVLHGQGLPMQHFAPPGIFGAPPIDEVGLEFDPAFARQQLAAAGYPDCQGFPQVTLVGYSGCDAVIEYAQAQWAEHLGCRAELIQIKQLPFRELLNITEDTSDEKVPHMWTMAWAPDYPDENNWVGDVLWCKSVSRNKRTCNEIDDLIVQAREETDPERRSEMYRQIEEMFFGPQGETPFFPISVRTALTAQHSWLERTPAPFGGAQWYTWTIDQEAQLAARR